MILADFQSHNLHCLVLQGPLGTPCGYVGVPSSHSLYGVGYDEPIPDPYGFLWKRATSNPVESIGIMNAFCAREDRVTPCILFQVHGGLTFSNKMRDRDDWYFGFDTQHAWDGPEVQNVEYVTEQCKRLAAQLAGFPCANEETL